jgi:1-aminocyclopropane-1-carboxylate deaminase
VPETSRADVLRLDLLHNEISGNKWFKLKHNLQKVKDDRLEKVITFGGAHSNHLVALAAMCHNSGLQSVAIVRGEEPSGRTPTLRTIETFGMKIQHLSRGEYEKKDTQQFKDHLVREHGAHLLIPEGGSNVEGVLGCTEIWQDDWEYDYVFCACGTGTTFAGLVASVPASTSVIGISVLRGENTLGKSVRLLLKKAFPGNNFEVGEQIPERGPVNGHLITNAYAFSGYASFDPHLAIFKTQFEERSRIPLDHIYTVKLFFALFDLVQKGKLKENSSILVIHSGGLQGNEAFESRYHLKPSR